jgi:hypothetical protein
MTTGVGLLQFSANHKELSQAGLHFQAEAGGERLIFTL